jgi:hypothetical protein
MLFDLAESAALDGYSGAGQTKQKINPLANEKTDTLTEEKTDPLGRGQVLW